MVNTIFFYRHHIKTKSHYVALKLQAKKTVRKFFLNGKINHILICREDDLDTGTAKYQGLIKSRNFLLGQAVMENR